MWMDFRVRTPLKALQNCPEPEVRRMDQEAEFHVSSLSSGGVQVIGVTGKLVQDLRISESDLI
jgi:hypothetical protein